MTAATVICQFKLCFLLVRLSDSKSSYTVFELIREGIWSNYLLTLVNLATQPTWKERCYPGQ